ncbi:hypothetical protein D3C78_1195800 [compost metagenome]
MQGAAVVEAPQLTGIEPLHQAESGFARHRDKAPVGVIKPGHLLHRSVERSAQKVRHADFRYLPQRIQGDDRREAAVVAVAVFVAKLYGDFAKAFE